MWQRGAPARVSRKKSLAFLKFAYRIKLPRSPAPLAPQFHRESRMKKLLRCCDVIPGCDFIARGVNENEIIMRATRHARLVHDVRWITPDLLNRVLAAIRDDEPVIVEG